MEFRTKINKWETKPIIKYNSKVLLLGSCFAEHLYAYLKQLKYQAFLNPCGITYNPVSLTNAIHYLAGNIDFNEQEIIASEGRYFHYDFHGHFASTTAEELKKKVKKNLKKGQEYFPPDVVIISLGTAFVYTLSERNEVVNNCHKMPGNIFIKSRMSIDQIETSLTQAIETIISLNKDCTVLLTVSPVRHIKDGIIENNRSKASLLLAAEILEKTYEQVHYFPSYELLLDDLRDYRFYDTDLIHPSRMAIEYIMEFFESHYFDEHEQLLRNRVESITKRLNHKPFLPASRQHQDFLQKLLLDIINLEAVKAIDFSKEKEWIKTQLMDS